MDPWVPPVKFLVVYLSNVVLRRWLALRHSRFRAGAPARLLSASSRNRFFKGGTCRLPVRRFSVQALRSTRAWTDFITNANFSPFALLIAMSVESNAMGKKIR